jgi:hypothetical protein
MTGEHLWPAWASELFGKKKFVNTRREEGGKVITWEHDELNAKARVVCGACNNGWMSDLENRMKVVAADMVVKRSPKLLEEKEIATIAAFGFVKAVVGDYMHENRPPFYSAEERHLFRRTLSIPRGVQIWLASMDGQHGVFKSMGGEAPLNTPGRIKLNVFTYGLGYLVIQIVGVRWMKKSRNKYSSAPLLLESPEWNTTSIPIWPDCRTLVSWPPPSHLPHKSIDGFVKRWIE